MRAAKQKTMKNFLAGLMSLNWRISFMLIILFLFCLPTQAQTPVQLAPVAHQQFLAADGTPLAGGLLYTYNAGTTTPAPTWVDSAGTFLNSNPIVLDAGGFATIYVGIQSYKLCVANASNVQQWCVDNINPFQIQSGTTFAGPITFSNLMNALDGGSFAGTFTGNPTFSGNPIFSGAPNFTGAFSLTGAGILQGVVYPWIDPMASTYGAKCDGTTDDSTALQAALSAAVSADIVLKLPPGKTCLFATGLVTTASPRIEGYFDISSGGGGPPNLKYTGTGTAITVNNGITLIYNPNFKHFYLLNTQGGSNGISCTYCNSVFLEGVQVGGSPGQLATAYNFSNTAAIVAINMQDFNAVTAVNLTGDSNVDIDACNLFQNTIVFLLGTGTIGPFGLHVHNCVNIEEQDYLVDIDDANPVNTSNSLLDIHFDHNFMAFGGGATYPHQQVLHVSNTGTSFLSIQNMVFADNTIYCNSNCEGTDPFNIAISSTTNASTAVNLTIERNWVYAGGSWTGILTANSTKVSGVLRNNFNTLGADIAGTSNICVEKYVGTVLQTCGLSTTGPISGVVITDSSLLTSLKRIHWGGTPVTTSNFSISGWGTGAAVLAVSQNPVDESGSILITSGSGSISANPTVTFTFADGTGTNNVVCSANRTDLIGSGNESFRTTTFAATSNTFTFAGTPTTTSNYGFTWHCDFH
jgi:hypothetical protein